MPLYTDDKHHARKTSYLAWLGRFVLWLPWGCERRHPDMKGAGRELDTGFKPNKGFPPTL